MTDEIKKFNNPEFTEEDGMSVEERGDEPVILEQPMTLKEVAKLTGYSKSTLGRAVACGALVGKAPAGTKRPRYSMAAVQDWMEGLR